MEIKNLKKAADRIKQAVKNKERIIIYGDSDLDGSSAVVILKETINTLGQKVAAVYFPEREKEGYGINKTGLRCLKKFSPALLVTLDLGIGSIEETVLAKKMGFEVIIIDHHEIIHKVPDADIVVDPKQKGDKYPFKQLATVGIVFKLAELILGKELRGNLKKSFLELTALATLADMMPKKEDNIIFIDEGTPLLKNSFRPGIRIFWKKNYFGKDLNLHQTVSQIISLLNVRDIKRRLPASYRLLTAPTLLEAEKTVKPLLKKHKERKEKVKKIVESIEKKIGEGPDKIIFEGDKKFESVLMSSAASMLCRTYLKPVFLYKKMLKESLGTVRTTRETDSVALMKKCSKWMITYGGHPQASGFRVKNSNLDNLKTCLIDNLK